MIVRYLPYSFRTFFSHSLTPTIEMNNKVPFTKFEFPHCIILHSYNRLYLRVESLSLIHFVLPNGYLLHLTPYCHIFAFGPC